ncbi:MAG: hypothetical protein IID36_12270 [Planctomycetes bacterium]|nr:hypothetical protein [Planctomycetota bacterium]
MQNVRDEFERREKEVNVFFKFLRQTLETDAKLIFEGKKTWKRRPIDVSLPKILKSSAYLVLYNLVESTVTLALARLNGAMSEDGLTYADADECIRKLWVDSCLKDLAAGADHGTYLEVVRKLAQDVQDGQIVEIPAKFSPVSGNLDARKMRELAGAYGFPENTLTAKRGSEKLRLVKERRNDLAHGDKSFAELSADDTIEDLEKTKNHVLAYLREFLRHVRVHVEQQGYRAS